MYCSIIKGCMPMDNKSGLSGRRKFLKVTGGLVTVGTAGLAGCSGNGGDSGGSGDSGGDSGGSSGDSGGSSGDSSGDSGGSDYPARELTWINGGSAGGGFDQYSQATSRYLPSHLPNDVDITVQTMGSWTQGNAQIYNADPDGYTVGIVNTPGNIVTQVLQDPPWDLTELRWFGRIARSVYTMGVAADSDYQSWEDLRDLDRPARFATTGQGTSTLSTILGATALGIDLELVTGYAGTPEMVTGVLRGDADALQAPSTTTPMANAINEGEVRPILHYGEELSGILEENAPDITTVIEAGYPELAGQANLQRSCAAPPETPDDILGTLETALDDAVHSDEYQTWAADQGRPIDYANAQETTEAVQGSLEFVQENQDVFDQYLG